MYRLRQLHPPRGKDVQGLLRFLPGESGKGDGPAAPVLKTAPADLTALAEDNDGKFPANRFVSILRGQATVTVHGNHDMPVWGPLLWRLSQGHQSEVQ